MPEGDTIFRTAANLRTWIGGRTVTAARSSLPGVRMEKAVGSVVDGVEARGKHLLVRFSTGVVLHTHMRMTGSWHVYATGAPWRRPAWRAKVVVEAGDRTAVCFDAPVVELLADRDERSHAALAALGPDVLVEPFDLAEVRRRAATRSARLTAGELLLDQRVVAGIGNVYRCEALFLEGVDPWTPRSALAAATLDRLVLTAARLMRANAQPEASVGRDLGAGQDGTWVYRRAGRPCRRCGTLVRSARLGAQARTCYWCPACQPAHAGERPEALR